jgi:hypothetical protein
MASTYLSRTHGTPTNAKKWTISFWSKSINLGLTNAGQEFFSVGISGSDEVFLRLETDGTISSKEDTTASSAIWAMYPNGVYRDANGWRHIVMSFDTTLATATDRSKMYINGEDVSSTIGFSGYTNVPLNFESIINQSGYIFNIGRRGYNNDLYFDGSMTHFHFIDGTAYDASTFGETDTATGIWKPKTAPVVTYGTNGFFLKFENSASFGTDSSVNGNNFTVNGTMTQTIDTPSNVFCTMNPLDTFNSPTITNGNTVINAGASDKSLRSTLGFSQGKYYWEVKIIPNNSAYLGIINSEKALAVGYDLSVASTNSVIFEGNGGDISKNGSSVGSYTGGAGIYGFAFDLDAGTLKLSKDGVFFNSGNAVVTGISADTYLPLFAPNGGGSPTEFQVNFGNGYFGTTPVSSAENPDDGIGIFEYEVPTGYKALCTKSINATEYN